MPASPLEAVAAAYCAHNGMILHASVGTGAFKETFSATLPDGRLTALKVYKQGFNVQRVLREVEALARCNHSNIAELFAVEAFDLGGTSYLVSTEELLTGGTLSQRLAIGLLTPGDVLALGGSLIDAVSTIAGKRLVHRDLKPDNIMFRGDGVSPVVVDFGLVRDLGAESITQTWQMQGPGTPLFAPPEQLRNDKAMIDWRSDQFALGVVLSYAAFGFHPYDYGGDRAEVIVERVAVRGSLGSQFIRAAEAARLGCLVPMVQPWPVGRVRTPSALSEQWHKQQEP